MDALYHSKYRKGILGKSRLKYNGFITEVSFNILLTGHASPEQKANSFHQVNFFINASS